MAPQILNHKPNILIIGVGNDYRSDDGVGLIVARKLKKKKSSHMAVIEQSGEGAALIELWKDADTVILIDAVFSAAEPGTIHRFDAHVQPIPTNFFRYSTHAFSISEAIELARELDQLPPRLIFYGIEGKNFKAGVKLSPEVEKASKKVATVLATEFTARQSRNQRGINHEDTKSTKTGRD